MRYFLGVDGGASKTMAVVIDEHGETHGWGKTGGSNHQTIGIERALANIRGAIDQALHKAGLSAEDIDYAVYGLAGADRSTDLAVLEPALATLPIRSWQLVCDTMIGLRTGSPSYTGVVLICGSGTNAAGRNKSGKVIQTGGFGYLFGDWAGGYDLARHAFRMAIRSWEGREEPSMLVERVPAYLGFADVPTMVNHYLDHPLSRVPPDLAIIVHEAANAGDALAGRLLWKTGRELGLAAHSVALRLGDLEPPWPLVLIGSVLQKGRHPIVLEGLRETLDSRGWSYQLVIPEVPPVCGALWLALDAQGIHLPMEIAAKWVFPETTTPAAPESSQ
jgi:N-acetylglucosamine kinase-like BadF-type ATPase